MLTIFIRAVILYLVLIAVIRVLGKRQLGQLEPSEVAVTMLVADLASFPMQEEQIPIWAGIVPILAVLGLEIVLSWVSMRNVKIRKLLCGKPVILMENGKFLQENMRKNRVTLDELVSQLREKMCSTRQMYNMLFWRPAAICRCFSIHSSGLPLPRKQR